MIRSSLAELAFARAGLSRDGALVVSVDEFRRAVNVCRAHPKVAVLTSPGAGPAELARALFPQTPRSFVVCEDLDGPRERVVHVRPAEATTRPWNDPDVVLVLDERRPPDKTGWISGALLGPPGWALPHEAFGGSALAPEIRAFVLARLGPRLGDMVWDVGSGDGSVGIECARFGAAVVAVESEETACERIRRNVRAHGVRVAVARGEIAPGEIAPGHGHSVLEHLPGPDAVFARHGGQEMSAALAVHAAETLSRMVVLAAAEEARAILDVLTEQGFTAGAVRLQVTPLAPAAASGGSVVAVWARRGGTVPVPRAPRTARPTETVPIEGRLP
ncbi:cobalamin biosynthesis bifunctional protein CbiET [Actinomadura graeca]|uniref:Cobalamin biosynthesis bifunctional protein CbiET n=1 Tax=Actinomadura graeca TaxID=2750812 RepID=A0ABX8QQI9_9ACTN|nr:cobalamin biosynthesis bifunctional protein CbiET [Actinomadura graeca]QXJ21050.1 cobalamin biosynthesis bifunctional protein CbiET [Actinomadura graeca]